MLPEIPSWLLDCFFTTHLCAFTTAGIVLDLLGEGELCPGLSERFLSSNLPNGDVETLSLATFNVNGVVHIIDEVLTP